MTTSTCLPREALTFLRDLRAHNDKDWMAANKARCEADLVEPARSLVRHLTAELSKSFPHITGSDAKTGGSLTRLHRDTRFSKDKSPYNAHLGLHFWHASSKKMEAPGFFLRIDPDAVLVATGMHQPEPEPLARIRKAIDRDRKAWTKASRGDAFVKSWGGLEGESLKRVPAPWPADHPFADDLRRKDFTAFARIPSKEATAAGFSSDLVRRWKASAPRMTFLCQALDLPF